MKSFDIPSFYRSPVIGKIKSFRKLSDPRKKDFSPTLLDFGPVRFLIPRHFGFCYGVENAIEISYRALEENPGKRIFLLSQMIHNPEVNADLESRGIRFLMDTKGNHLFDWSEITSEDIVLIPAFGTTIETEKVLKEKGIQTEKYNTTCPFVEKVWKRAEKLSSDTYTIIIHGKPDHEETRATFSHSRSGGPSVIIRDIKDAEKLADFITGKSPASEFFKTFEGCYSEGFDPTRDLKRIGVVNQTTMLAKETQGIAEYLKSVIISIKGEENFQDHFADTRDTLCYATNDNQDSTYGVMEKKADMAIVVGGYNSSNTSHLAELLESKFPTYFIRNEGEIISSDLIRHFNFHTGEITETSSFLPESSPATIVITSGASCPDSVVDRVIHRILEFYPDAKEVKDVISKLEQTSN